MEVGGVAAIFIHGTSYQLQTHFLQIHNDVKHSHLLKNYVVELLYRKDYSAESRPELPILDRVF